MSLTKQELLAEFEEFYRQLHGLPDDALLAGGKLMKDFVFKAFDAGVESEKQRMGTKITQALEQNSGGGPWRRILTQLTEDVCQF